MPSSVLGPPEGGLARDGLDPAGAGGDALLERDEDEADVAGPLDVGAAAELLREAGHVEDADLARRTCRRRTRAPRTRAPRLAAITVASTGALRRISSLTRFSMMPQLGGRHTARSG